VVVPRVGSAKLSDGSTIKADGQLQGSPSQLFDAVAVLLSKAGVTIDLDLGVTELDETFIAADAKRFWDREPKLCLLA
jgi:catalase